MIADELFGNVAYIIGSGEGTPRARNRMMHETLVLVCKEGLKDTHHAFGDLNAQVETLIRRLHIPADEANAIRRMRRHSNRSVALLPEDLRYDAHALALFIGRVFGVPVPQALVHHLPWDQRPQEPKTRANAPDKRCIVQEWDEKTIKVVVDEDGGGETMTVRYAEDTQYARMEYLAHILRQGMHLNLLGCHVEGGVITPRLSSWSPTVCSTSAPLPDASRTMATTRCSTW
jgi:hypothetical protein